MRPDGGADGDGDVMAVDLVKGDCLSWLPNMSNKSVDLILADMPYGTTRAPWDSQIDLQRLWPELRRVCGGAIVLFAQTPFDKVLGGSNLPMLRYEWIWEKTNATGHLNAKRAPMKAHENILVFYDRLPTYNPQKTSGHARKVATKRGDGSPLYGAQNLDGVSYNSTDRYPRSVQVFASDKQKSKLHETQKPVDLCRYLIRTYSNRGDNVLDFCMGSGTTGVACQLEGRNFWGIENDSEIFEIAHARIFGNSDSEIRRFNTERHAA